MKLVLFVISCMLICANAQLSQMPLEGVYTEQNTLSMVNYINNKVNTTWKADLSKFKDWSFASIKRIMGVSLDHLDKITQNLEVVVHDDVKDVPASFDSRDQWPDCPTIKEVRDQGNCGSCWAISAVEAMSDRICVASQGNVNKHLSTEDMVSCCHLCGMGCNGGYPEFAWEYFKKSGVCTGGNYHTNEGCKPYTIEECEHHTTGNRPPCQGESHTPKCTKSCTNTNYNSTYDKDKNFGKSVFTLNNAKQIQLEIMKNGPVQTAFTVYEDFLNYKSGVYQHVTGISVGGHAVKIVGWGVDDATNTPYWLIANSWNSDWAENGFFRILRGKNECGIEGGVVAGTPTF